MKSKTEKIRLKDVARDTGYSVSTVAKVLAGSSKESRISDSTAGKIVSVAKSLGYAPNLMARNLRSKKSGMIGIYLANANDSIIASTLTAILQKLPEKGFTPLLTVEDTGFDVCHETWIRNKVEGLLFCGPTSDITPESFRELRNNDIPVVIAGNPYTSGDKSVDSTGIGIVQINNKRGIQLTIDHLIGTGRRRIAFISGPSWHSDAEERKTAYSDFIIKHHTPVIADIGGRELFWRRGYLSAEQLLKKYPDIDAIIAYDDNVALGAVKYLSDISKKIPDDIAVAGFDNQPFSEYSIPSLTTVDQPTDVIGKTSVDLLENLITKREISEKHIYIEPFLVIRASTSR